MELRDIPFISIGEESVPKPWLALTLINPQTDQCKRIFGLIDTGADECAFPASYAGLIGHDLEKGIKQGVHTGGGITCAYAHTVSMQIQDLRIDDVLVDFLPQLSVPLLGVKSFLSQFVLTIDYPSQRFSLIPNQ